MKHFALFLFCGCGFLITLRAQNEQSKQFEYSGYLKEMHSSYFLQNAMPLPSGNNVSYIYYNLIHHRMNMVYRPFKNAQIDVGMRNRILSGALIREVPQYKDILSLDYGAVDLSYNLYSSENWLVNTTFDRLSFDYTYQKLQLKVGRQRVNWGIGMVWNPNDIFNTFSYIDFDYEERPGSDAVALTWYKSSTSSLDVVGKIGRNGPDSTYNFTTAARYLFNYKNYDIQFLGGKYLDDAMMGMGWSGAIQNVSFRGEASVFVPVFNTTPVSETAVSATMEGDYTFKNSVYLGGGFLYNSSGSLTPSRGLSLVTFRNNLSAKMLSFGMFETYANISYPMTPIVTLGFVTLFNPADYSALLNPSITISLANNLDLLVSSQSMVGKPNTEYAANGNTYAVFGRLKWSFANK